jgi:RNA-binding protein 25
MEEMQALAEEQRKAGLLLDDGAPVKLAVSLAPQEREREKERDKDGGKKGVVLGGDEEDDAMLGKRKVSLVKLDFSAAEGEKAKEALEKIRVSVPRDKETLFKAKVRWDGLSDVRPFSSFILNGCLNEGTVND